MLLATAWYVSPTNRYIMTESQEQMLGNKGGPVPQLQGGQTTNVFVLCCQHPTERRYSRELCERLRF